MYNNLDTIFALSSASGKAGVAVIRISGTLALGALQSLTGKSNWAPNQLKFAKFYNENHQLIDEGMAVYFAAPRSFTGEHSVELNIHGSRAVIEKILTTLGDKKFRIKVAASQVEFSNVNLRLAKRGEFSRRAFENGKMDLTQVEGLSDLINADTEMQRAQSLRQMGGDLAKVYHAWRERIVGIHATLEALIDFSDDEIPSNLEKNVEKQICDLITKMQAHIQNGQKAKRLREGIAVAILGEPNVGKSSLFNVLLGRQAAIVSSIPGTTRDVIEAYIDMQGYPIILADTAGIRETLDEIESLGVRLALERAENADIQIWVGSELEGEIKCAENIINVINKADLIDLKTANMATKEVVFTSTKTGQGIDELQKAIIAKAAKLGGLSESPLMTRARHQNLIEKACEDLQSAQEESAIDLKCELVRRASFKLGELIGKVDIEEVLGKIFGEFCIGK